MNGNHEPPDLTLYPCAVCRELGLRKDRVACSRCGGVLCLTCAAGAGCPRGQDHAPAGWSVRTATGVWAASPRFWPGRQLHRRAVRVHLQGFHAVADEGGHPTAGALLWVECRNRGMLPPDLEEGQPVQVLVNGWAVLSALSHVAATPPGLVVLELKAPKGGLADWEAFSTYAPPPRRTAP